MCDEIAMLKGEKRKIRLYVHSRKNDVFVIRNAYIEILQYGELIKTIECTIDEHNLTFMLALDEAGSYSMSAVYEIADEIIKNKFKIEYIDKLVNILYCNLDFTPYLLNITRIAHIDIRRYCNLCRNTNCQSNHPI